MTSSLFSTPVRTIDGVDTTLEQYRGKALLIVNVASKCGLTPQYEGLEKLQQQFGARGFTVLGFPCNQFAGQEPGSESEIRDFCDSQYHISFPLFAKIEVNGEHTHPLYTRLKEACPGSANGGEIEWNFTKFLVDRAGNPVERLAPAVTPAELASSISKLLG